MDPEQRSCHLPFLKFAAATEPLGGSFVLTVGREVVVCGRIGRRLPFYQAVSQLGPCDCVRHLAVGDDGGNDERFTSSRLLAVRCMITAVRLPSKLFKISGVDEWPKLFAHRR